ncbi:YtoQ family protein [Halobacillus karajensis]|uniref:YtoQ family protein n=1 Tax=Halobacillus karajensis TaxID=195088 RepID=A0A024P7U6_9BACI|nr:YtoQ family protein [Halobacillus karajensis]CDQ18337.1 YtoQ family protein [Halobacillus karajensis]CDQ24691.1 YtoQ family protein [Halobacillus karajensis]CDQ29063.1 YtoQ family protein [Halobacillus karajensis]SEI06590.1 YtoQ family protein [Halobacillus karajensis]
MALSVYLAGQIHDDWRNEVRKKAEQKALPLHFTGPQEDHSLSDDIGEKILGEQPSKEYHDDAASSINNFRTRILLQKADVVIAYFGESYKQWNTALDAGSAIQAGKPLILIRPDSLIHPLKELSNQADVTVKTIDQALEVLAYLYK